MVELRPSRKQFQWEHAKERWQGSGTPSESSQFSSIVGPMLNKAITLFAGTQFENVPIGICGWAQGSTGLDK